MLGVLGAETPGSPRKAAHEKLRRMQLEAGGWGFRAQEYEAGAIPMRSRFHKLGSYVGVLMVRALLFGVNIGAIPIFACFQN